MNAPRKRVISSCVPCYTRKQKTSSPAATSEVRFEERSREKRQAASGRALKAQSEWNSQPKSTTPASHWAGSSIAESFGYFEDSGSNTLAVIQKVFPRPESLKSSPVLLPEASEEVQRHIRRMPDRQIIDFLMQFYVAEVHWMDQLVHVPWLLAKYQTWASEGVTAASGVDFVVLILRICAYATQFLPAPGYIMDKVRGVPLTDVRSMCEETADNLDAIAMAADGRGSLIRVQHQAYHGLHCQIDGKMGLFWDAVSQAIRTAQSVGIHCDAVAVRRGVDGPTREMERRTFCILYIWDSLLSRKLDRVPVSPGRLRAGSWPQLQALRSGAEGDTSGSSKTGGAEVEGPVPDLFTERLLQARLADFWRSASPWPAGEYDAVEAEERYERFFREYVEQLPPVFALTEPDQRWDERRAKLALQRLALHISVYEMICWNFRPLLLQQSATLPMHKLVMVSVQKRKLAAAALCTLRSVKQLHALLGGCHTRLACIVFSAFEAGVLLACLCAEPQFPEDYPVHHIPPPGALRTDPLQGDIFAVTQDSCLQAARGALRLLEMLAEVSHMAEVGATTLAKVLARATEGGTAAKAGVEGAAVVSSREPEVPTLVTSMGPSSVASSQLRGSTAAAEVPLWLHNDIVDLRPLDMMGADLTVGDFSVWPPLDASHMYSQDAEY
ncbi:hypothetical protein CMQ_2704 [Grosmannia clavigera kw1407]|uniref:Transcription factor domain-containing protein n=1 Tax=Grosmannia clavigera (strain kw1407 / UAMH 11150) TaxID=655863 RepID=F0XI87_GROCL|nr:uncharacterized protein CMQ_2704 [Grosmannia clavigera kw1407]EFX02775.1 hypothetical protein CMQ_2704 [Grosmannia clavigera kw1407]